MLIVIMYIDIALCVFFKYIDIDIYIGHIYDIDIYTDIGLCMFSIYIEVGMYINMYTILMYILISVYVCFPYTSR